MRLSPRPHRHPRQGWAAALAVLLLPGLAACGLLREPLPTPSPTPTMHVTADQVVQAMEADEFYATYGHTTLEIQGTVASVDRQPGHVIVQLATSGQTALLCDAGNYSGSVKNGDAITALSTNPEQDVSRQDSAVMIRNCGVP